MSQRSFVWTVQELNLILIIWLHTQLNGFKYSKWLNSSNWLIDGTLSGPTTPGQSEPGSNDNEEVLHILQSSWTGASPSDPV